MLDANVEIAYNGTATTCLQLGLKFVADIVAEGSEECDAARDILFEPCCYAPPTEPCVLCASSTSPQGDIRDDTSVNFYGSTTTCFDLNSFLVSREEQVGFICQAAKTELQETCCFQECKICGAGGNLYWDNPTTFNDITFACGELTWVLSGSSVEEGSEECDKMQSTYYEDCCSGPSALIPLAASKCEICPTSGKDYFAQVIHSGKEMTCLELDSVLLQKGVFVESAECEQAKLEYSSNVSLTYMNCLTFIIAFIVGSHLLCMLLFSIYSAAISHQRSHATYANQAKSLTAFWTKLSPTMGLRLIVMAFTITSGLDLKPRMMHGE